MQGRKKEEQKRRESKEPRAASYTGTILIIRRPWDCPYPGTMKTRYRCIVLCDHLTGVEAIKLNCPRTQCTELCKLVVRCKYRQPLLINLPKLPWNVARSEARNERGKFHPIRQFYVDVRIRLGELLFVMRIIIKSLTWLIISTILLLCLF